MSYSAASPLSSHAASSHAGSSLLAATSLSSSASPALAAASRSSTSNPLQGSSNASIELDLSRITEQELLLRFVRFDADNAWDLGLRLRAAAGASGASVAIAVGVGGHNLFMGVMPGVPPVNSDTARRQANIVRRFHTSSYAVNLKLQRDRATLESKYGLNSMEYAAYGGSFPLWVTTAGCIGTITVAGLGQRDNHRLIVSVLVELLGIKAPELDP